MDRPTSTPNHLAWSRRRRTGEVSWRGAALTLALALFSPALLAGQTVGAQEPDGDAAARRVGGAGNAQPALQAVRAQGAEPELDGRLDEDVWSRAPVATEFTQFAPDEGAPASQRTEARVLYGDDALFVGLRAWDTAADSIVGQLTRRDQPSYSDQLNVIVDSYFDRRTAFHFAVNPRGVKSDYYRFDDTQEDAGWDAVWQVATSVDDEGWTAEFRIPYSQLRFRDAEEQTWGINFMRRIARHDEMSVWAPTGQSDAAIVSRLGELRGLRDLEMPRRLEITPYSLARLQRAPGEPADPFHSANDFTGTLGADAKYGVTGDLTLDVTINPDFGQVEADPAQVNLSAFETFLPERRPFFLEGSSLYGFSLALGDGDGANESLFYSRRIGRAPQGASPGLFQDRPDNSTIMGAWKLSGKTAAGWSIGTLMAVTGEERADVVSAVGEPVQEVPVEPLTTYAVARVARDFREGRTAVGGIVTGVSRDGEVAEELGLRSGAYTAGVDARHRFGNGDYELSGYLIGSNVRGSEEAIAATQRSSARWFHRPDADHLTYDPTRTSLSGASGQLGLRKVSGGHWRWSMDLQTRSPGFEPNDAGFLRETDLTILGGFVGYDQSSPQGPFRSWRLNTSGFTAYSYGWERYNTGGNFSGNVQLKNFWSGYTGVSYNHGGLSNALLRGGPGMLRDPSWNGWWGMNSDSRKSLRANVNGGWSVRPESESWSWRFGPNLTWRPSGRASVSLGTSFNRSAEDLQWVGRVEDASGGDHYLFGRMEQRTLGLTARVDYAFTPTLSLQVYAEPFVSAGEYGEFKQVVAPRAAGYDERVGPVDPRVAVGDDDVRRYFADLDGDGMEESWRAPDFNLKQFRSNAVMRWEYRPGSALFVVWSQGRDHFDRLGAFDVAGDFESLFGARADDVFMVKLSYWLNP